MTISYRLDKDGGLIVGDTETGRTSYAQPSSKNAAEASKNAEPVAQQMAQHENAAPLDLSHKADSEKHWNAINQGHADGSTKEAERASGLLPRMTAADNAGPQQTSAHPPASTQPPMLQRIATSLTNDLRPHDGMAPQPRVATTAMPGGAFATRSSLVEQWHANRQSDLAATPQTATPPPTPAATPAAGQPGTTGPRPSMLDRIIAAHPPEIRNNAAALAQSAAVTMAKALAKDGDYAS